jgi:hypothetical protein
MMIIDYVMRLVKHVTLEGIGKITIAKRAEIAIFSNLMFLNHQNV